MKLGSFPSKQARGRCKLPLFRCIKTNVSIFYVNRKIRKSGKRGLKFMACETSENLHVIRLELYSADGFIGNLSQGDR